MAGGPRDIRQPREWINAARGGDDRYIAAVDRDGVALASIQALYEIVKRQQEEIDGLRALAE